MGPFGDGGANHGAAKRLKGLLLRLDDLGAWIAITVFFFLVVGILNLLFRFMGDCRRDVAAAEERVVWPVTTVEAHLTHAFLKARRAGRPPDLKGRYSFEFGGKEHTVEKFEPMSGSREELERAAEALEAEGKTIEVEIQYNPLDPAEAYTEVVTQVPRCIPWIGAFILLFAGILLLLLRGYYRLLTG